MRITLLFGKRMSKASTEMRTKVKKNNWITQVVISKKKKLSINTQSSFSNDLIKFSTESREKYQVLNTFLNCQSNSALDGRHQRRYELTYRDDIGRSNRTHRDGIGAANQARSTSIDGGLSSLSHSLPSSFRHWVSLESIQRNQRLRQLAAQSTTKVKYLIRISIFKNEIS